MPNKDTQIIEVLLINLFIYYLFVFLRLGNCNSPVCLTVWLSACFDTGCRLGCPGTHYVKPGWPRDQCASAPLTLGLKGCSCILVQLTSLWVSWFFCLLKPFLSPSQGPQQLLNFAIPDCLFVSLYNFCLLFDALFGWDIVATFNLNMGPEFSIFLWRHS